MTSVTCLTALLLAAPAPAGAVETVWDLVQKGGPLMVPIGLCSLIGLAVLVEHLITLRRRSVIPPGFLAGLRKALAEGDRQKGIDYCRRNGSPVANVFAAGIRRLGESPELLEKHIVEAGQREVLRLRRNLRALSVIASVSPLLGLLGTIFGMIQAFAEVSRSGEALGKTELLAAGIYQAMVTTAAGLIVAIPALIFYHFLVSKVERLVMEIDEMTVNFVDEYAARRAESKSVVAPASENGAAGRGQKAEISGQHAGRGIEAAQAATATTGARA